MFRKEREREREDGWKKREDKDRLMLFQYPLSRNAIDQSKRKASKVLIIIIRATVSLSWQIVIELSGREASAAERIVINFE